MTSPPTAVVLMAYGSPRSRDGIEAYYTDIRRGRPPTAEQLAHLVARYDAIGGTSPLTRVTTAQRNALAAALERRGPGGFDVILGMKHAEPTIEQALDKAAENGVERAVGLVLAPHYSAGSVGEYLSRAAAGAARHGIEFSGIRSWATQATFVEFCASEVRERLAEMPANTKVLFTAHSLPRRVVDAGDPYENEVRSTAAAVARAAGLASWSQWAVVWQSAGRSANRATDPWLGPDVLEAIDDLAPSENAAGVLVCPCGFVADHLEVLYDLDVEARRRAEARGLAFGRTATVGENEAVIAGLADLVAGTAAQRRAAGS